MVWILIVLLGAAADQLIKAVVSAAVATGTRLPVIDGFFYIVHRSNSGAAWSLFADKAWGGTVLAVVAGIGCLVMLGFILFYPDTRVKACLAFLCAGSLGNLVDRIRFGGVTDFLDLHFGTYVFPTFNLADSLIVCSSIALAFLVVFARGLGTARTPTRARRKEA